MKTGFITFVQLRKILEKLNIELSSKLAEYLIFILKSNIHQGEASIYDLKYSNLYKILEEIDNIKIDDDEFSDDSGIEMTPEEYFETTNKVINKIALKTNNNPDMYFDKAVYSEGLYSIIDLRV